MNTTKYLTSLFSKFYWNETLDVNKLIFKILYEISVKPIYLNLFQFPANLMKFRENAEIEAEKARVDFVRTAGIWRAQNQIRAVWNFARIGR